MTLVGKIITVLIFIMSICFLVLSMMVFATHKNWKLLADNPTETAQYGLGLRQQLEAAQAKNQGLQVQLEQTKTDLAREKAARQAALAALETKLQAVSEELTTATANLRASEEALAAAVQELKLAQETTNAVTGQNTTLRAEIRDAQLDRDTQFAEVVRLTDELHESQGAKRRLEERQAQLLGQVTQMKGVLDRLGVRADAPVSHIPPELEGVVTAVAADGKLVEISVGSDDGLAVGHTLDVFSGGTYRGRITIRRTAPNRSVGEVDKDYQRGDIRKGDRVATKLS